MKKFLGLGFIASIAGTSSLLADDANLVHCVKAKSISAAEESMNVALNQESIEHKISDQLTISVSKPYSVSAPTIEKTIDGSLYMCVTLTSQKSR